MLSNKLQDLINDQINKEFYSAYLYLAYSNYCEDLGLDGFANWYEIQANEECDHAFLFRKFLLDNGAKVKFEGIEKPSYTLNSAYDLLEGGLKHEKYVTKLITNIYNVAFEEKDFKTMQFLDGFLKEQIEEEKNAEDLLKKMSLFGNDSKGLYLLNQELGQRTYVSEVSNAM